MRTARPAARLRPGSPSSASVRLGPLEAQWGRLPGTAGTPGRRQGPASAGRSNRCTKASAALRAAGSSCNNERWRTMTRRRMFMQLRTATKDSSLLASSAGGSSTETPHTSHSWLKASRHAGKAVWASSLWCSSEKMMDKARARGMFVKSFCCRFPSLTGGFWCSMWQNPQPRPLMHEPEAKNRHGRVHTFGVSLAGGGGQMRRTAPMLWRRGGGRAAGVETQGGPLCL